MDSLKKKNPHPRDECISFDEGPHIYTINGDSDFISVTTWNHSQFQKFDADNVIEKMMSSKKWPESKYGDFTEFPPPSNELLGTLANHQMKLKPVGIKIVMKPLQPEQICISTLNASTMVFR